MIFVKWWVRPDGQASIYTGGHGLVPSQGMFGLWAQSPVGSTQWRRKPTNDSLTTDVSLYPSLFFSDTNKKHLKMMNEGHKVKDSFEYFL